ncbi:hypothetical protein [Streptomyces sp. H27-D2]|uniref:hypothetical protein n=1 Tax=Streptomyces sp. H27-D2 TaxID=3046304 RepID=UPI002DB7ACDF|nr:hypothetical protein [Streptomyces sp. H27-D2]MEC4018131.1 hypothetical protein [Streptomyces sp. H27-D2]
MPTPISYDRTAVDRLGAHQRGLATRSQLIAAGMPSATIAKRTRAGGPWRRLLPHVILLNSGAPDPYQLLLAAVLYAADQTYPARLLSGDTALLTGTAALRLRARAATFARGGAGAGLPDPAELVRVLVPGARRLTDTGYVRIMRTRRWPAALRVEGIPCTRASRAAADAAARWEGDPDALRALLTSTVQRGICQPDALLAELAAAQLGSNPTVATAAEDLASGVASVAEAHARDLIRRSDLPDPLWNPELRTPTGRFIARPDAYWPDAGVVLEVDSLAHHFLRDAWQHTQERRLRMEGHGLRVVTVTPTTIRRDPDQLLHTLKTALASGLRAGAPAGVRVHVR